MKYHIWTVGCQMNVADSRKLAAGLDRAGCDATDAIDDADLVVLNTCSVREKAQEVLDADRKKVKPSPPQGQSRHIFGVRCRNGHVSYFDKRLVCSAYKEVPRESRQSAGIELDELHLKCDRCRVEVVAREDCRGYK